MRLLKFILIAISFSFFFSCDNMTEEIYLNNDGSGEYKIYTNMIPGMVQMMSAFAAMDTTFQGTTEDLTTMIEEKIWEDFPAEVDSIMDMSGKKIPEEIENDPEKLAMFGRVENFMKGSKSKGYMNAGIKFKFADMEELNKFLILARDSQTGRDREVANMNNVDTETDFSYKKRCLKRVMTYTINEENQEETSASAKEMFGDAKMITIVHLPKNVKSVKGNGMTLKNDKKVIFEYDLLEISEGKVDTDFEIKLEKR